MSIPVNLYVDRMSPVQPVRVADVYAVTQDRSSAYKEAAAKIGLTTREYAEFRQALNDGGAIYVVLPRHIDAMAGIHRRDKSVYALRNVVVPRGTMGWQVNLADGTSVLVPQICGNLSMNRGHAIATRPRVVAQRPQPKAVKSAAYVTQNPAAVAETPVVFDAPPVVAPVGLPVTGAAAAAGRSALPFLGLLLPVIGSLTGNHNTTPITPVTPEVAPCSAGSNLMGVCR